MGTSGERSDGISNVASSSTLYGNPAAGADFSIAITASGMLVAVTATLATSATVANRLPSLQVVTAAGVQSFSIPSSSVQAASLTETYVWGCSMPFASGNNQNLVPIPYGVVITSGGIIRTSTALLQAGDQWTNVVLTFSR